MSATASSKSSKPFKASPFNYTPSEEDRQKMRESRSGGLCYKMEDAISLVKHTLDNWGTKDIVFGFLHSEGAMSVFNKEEMDAQMRLWKELAKAGKLTVLECNNQTREVDGKKLYLLTITPRPNTASFDPVGMALGFMVSGYVYAFRNIKNRDAVFGYIKKFCKEEKECPLCGDYYSGYGNNPAPLKVEGQVCDDCNMNEVIPARMAEMNLKRKEKKEKKEETQ